MLMASKDDNRVQAGGGVRGLLARSGGGGWWGWLVLGVIALLCFGSLPWTLGRTADGSPRYDVQDRGAPLVGPWWLGASGGVNGGPKQDGPPAASPAPARTWMGTDPLGRDLLVRCLAGGGISLTIGILAAMVSVVIGTVYGAVAGWFGGRVDAVMMRVVDVLYGLPYVLLVVLLAVASDALIEEYITRNAARMRWMVAEGAAEIMAREPGATAADARLRAKERMEATGGSDGEKAFREGMQKRADAEPSLKRREVSSATRATYDVMTLLLAIGGVSWLTMARVIRGQVLSIKQRPFIEAARAIGAPTRRIFLRHLLPNLVGIIVVYATLTVPQAILQESFLSFLGIGVKPPLPSWGNLAAEGLAQINPVKSHWWLLVFPCVLLAVTLLALNFVGEALRKAMEPGARR